jgi:hypothetical protein
VIFLCMFTSFVSRLITNAAVEKSVIYDGRETGIVEGKRLILTQDRTARRYSQVRSLLDRRAIVTH